jgi:hypothetical protein
MATSERLGGEAVKKEYLAAQLDGMEYPFDVPKPLKDMAFENGLVIIYGGSDDLMEFEGAIRDEITCYDGGTAYLLDGKLLKNECDDPRCPYYYRIRKTARKIIAIWDTDGYSWIYKTDIPHVTFDIVEGRDKYCRGIVFDLKEVKP